MDHKTGPAMSQSERWHHIHFMYKSTARISLQRQLATGALLSKNCKSASDGTTLPPWLSPCPPTPGQTLPVRNPHLPLAGTIAFGFVMTFSSGFGQTFFISLFNADIRTEFGLSHGEIGSLYSLATLLSAVTVIWSGKLLDTVDLRKYSLVVTLGLTVACLSISQATGPLTLAFSFYLLRLFGQGLSGHTGITTASRAPPAYRGRAISCAGLGFSTAEALLPLLIVIMVGLYGWRQVWQYAAQLYRQLCFFISRAWQSIKRSSFESGQAQLLPIPLQR